MSEPVPDQPGLSLRALGSPAALLTVAGLLGQAFAIVRTLYTADRVGTSSRLDALLVAEVLPVVVCGLLVSGVRTAMVPAYFDVASRDGELAARRFVGAIVTWTALLGTLGVAILVALPGLAIDVSGPGLGPAPRAAAIGFLPLLAPILVLSALAALLTSLCQVANRFLPIAIALVLAPLTSLIVTVVFWDQLGLNGLAIGMTLGYVVSIVATIAYVSAVGMMPPITLRIDLEQLNRFMRHAIPLTLGTMALQFNLLADRAVASIVSVGGVSALDYGQQIVLQPLGALSTAWTMVLYPSLVRIAYEPGNRSLGEGAARAMRFTIALFVPVVAAIAALAPLLVRVVYMRGAFDERSASLTMSAVAAFAPMLLLTMIQPIMIGAHNARRRGTLLGLTALANALLNVVLNVVFGLPFGVAGVALSTSVTVGLVMLFLLVRLAASEQSFDLRPLGDLGLRALLASLVPAIPIAILVWSVLPRLPLVESIAVLAGCLLAGGLAYFAIALLFGIREIRLVVAGLLGAIARPRALSGRQP